jgi:hypothetical protein
VCEEFLKQNVSSSDALLDVDVDVDAAPGRADPVIETIFTTSHPAS